MFSEKDILARLQNGESADAIAKEMQDAINGAIRTQKVLAEEAKAKEAAEQAKRQSTAAVVELQSILDLIKDWAKSYTKYDAADIDEIFEEVDADFVMELLEAVDIYIDAMGALKSIGMRATPVAKKPARANVKTIDPDKVLNNFLKDMGL